MIKHKSSGYILIMVMIIIGTISLLIINISLNVYSSKELSSAINEKHKNNLEISSSFAIIQSLLSSNFSTENKKENNKEKEEINNSNKDSIDKKNELSKFFKCFWTNFYKWNNYQFNLNGEKIDLSVYPMCENGKISLRYFLKKAISKIKENDKNNEKSENQNKEKETEIKEESKSDEKDEKLKKIFEDKCFKLFNEKILKKLKITNENEKNESESKDKENKILTIIKNYLKKQSFLPDSNFDLIKFNKDKIEVFKVEENKKNNDSSQKNYSFGEIFTIYEETFNPLFISPAIFEFFSKEKKNILSDDIRKKIGEEGEKFIKNGEDYKSFWTNIYEKNLKIAYDKDFFENEDSSDFFNYEKNPQFFGFLVKIKKNEKEFNLFALFEKIESFAKDSSESNYLLKQVFFL